MAAVNHAFDAFWCKKMQLKNPFQLDWLVPLAGVLHVIYESCYRNCQQFIFLSTEPSIYTYVVIFWSTSTNCRQIQCTDNEPNDIDDDFIITWTYVIVSSTKSDKWREKIKASERGRESYLNMIE